MKVDNLHKLIRKATDNNRYRRGEELLRKNRISDAYFTIEDGIIEIHGIVTSKDGYDKYSTKLGFNSRSERLTTMSCNCMDFYNSRFSSEYLICKHIVALGLFFEACNRGKDTENIQDEREKEYGNNLIDVLELHKTREELVNLEVYICERNGRFEGEMKIGTSQMYVVKSIKKLIEAIEEDDIIEYGKNFTFDGSRHYFSEKDNEILDYFEEYVDLQKRSNMFDTLSGKSIVFVNNALKRLILTLGDKSFTLNIDNNSYKPKVYKCDVPLDFEIKEDDDCIQLLSNKELPIPLTSKGDVMFYKGNIYLPSRNQYETLKYFHGKLVKDNCIKFDKKNLSNIIETVLPLVEEISENVNLDDKISKNIRRNCTVEFYLDRKGDEISCDVRYFYDGKLYKKDNKSDELIIRDIKTETKVKRALADAKFYENRNIFIFQGTEEDLFEFIDKKINKLKEIGEVFYSNKFKEPKIYRSPSISASIKEDKGSFLKFDFAIGDISPKEYNNILKAFKSKRKYYKLKDNSFIDLRDDETKEFLNFIDKVADKSNNGSIKIHNSKALYLNNILEDKKMPKIEGKELVEDISDGFNNKKNIDYKVPEELNATLREYQVEGFKWLKSLNRYNFGGILADEMGLGKTIQTIAFLLSEKGKKTIIVTPTSLIYNWENEFNNFAPNLKIGIVHGDKESREKVIENYKDFDVILTTYGVLRNEIDEFKKIKFHYCIIDEAQNIKNPLAQTSKAVKEINSTMRVALTGTPIENNLIELWSIFDFIMPGYLFTESSFRNKFINDNDGNEELKHLIRPFILRRLKKDVMIELPEKIEKKHFVEMTDTQKKIYSTYVKDISEKLEDKDVTKDKITIFSYLTTLRQLCLDPSLVVENYSGGSGKIDVALEIIKDDIENNHKILLFSQFTSVLDILGKELQKNKIEYLYLDGSTKAKDRLALVEEFNNSEKSKVFLISLKAGGTGLNLTSADVVIHFDPWWNPAAEEQATDRAHRMGQKNVVEVIKLIAKGTVEEKIITMQDEKKKLINDVIDGNLSNGSLLGDLTKEQLMDLFS